MDFLPLLLSRSRRARAGHPSLGGRSMGICLAVLTLLVGACSVDTGAVRFRCGTGIRCPEGLVCVEGFCADPATADAGSVADAGSLDASPPDAGLLADGGIPDAGSLDAGVPDAGVPDAGVPDAGVPDAGVPDAGVPDAGVPDAGVPDAGVPDAGFPAPSGLRVVPGGGAAELAWEPVAGADGYTLCHSAVSPACNGTTLTTNGRTTMRLEGLPLNTRFFAVRATRTPGTPSPPTADVDAPLFTLVERTRRDGLVPGAHLGAVFAPAGDVDADGRTDYLIGSPEAAVQDNALAGRAMLYSGRTGRLLFEVRGGAEGDRWGAAVSTAGDVNGDGRDDFIIAATGAGKVRVYSGADFRILHELTLTLTGGVTLAGIGDATGDGASDFAVGLPGANFDTGEVTLYSGATGVVVRTWSGSLAGERFGAALAGAGDVTGDGLHDIIVGEPGYGDGSGRAKVFMSTADAPVYTTPNGGAGQALATAVAGAGDVDGDGRADFLVAGPGGGPRGVTTPGRVEVFSGATGSRIHTVLGPGNPVGFGATVSSAGDIDGDGRSDFAVGAPDVGSGLVYVYSSAGAEAGVRLLYRATGTLPGDKFGATLGTGDIDGDGVPDLFVGAPDASPGTRALAGSALVIGSSGALGLVTAERANPQGKQGHGPKGAPAVPVGRGRLFTPQRGTPPYGWQLVTNRSTTATLDSGMYQAGSVGEVYDTIRVTDGLGRSRDTRIWLLDHVGQAPLDGEAGDLFGAGLAGIGDRDGDGKGDYVVGAPGPIGIGEISYCTPYSGATTTPSPKIDAPQAGDQFGTAIADAGDIDGDGVRDLVVSAPLFDETIGDRGKVFVHSGQDFGVLRSKLGDEALARYGKVVAGGVDLDTDGVPDFVVGAPFASPAALSSAGSVFVYSGANTGTGTNDGLIHRLNGAAEDERFGSCVAIVGDLNGDQTPDLIAGAPGASPNALSDAGSLRIFSGSDGSSIDQIDGAAAGEELGISCAALGDVNDDAVGDFAVGIRGAKVGANSNAGKVIVYSGADRAVLHELKGDAALGFFGWVVASAGDVDADGKNDVVVGKKGVGDIYVYSGASGNLLYLKPGPLLTGAFFERIVAGLGDVNGDGFDDFAVGVPEADFNGNESGRVTLYVSRARGATLSRPVAVTATPVSPTEVTVQWVRSDTAEDGFRLERRSVAGSWMSAGSAAADANQRSLSGLQPNTEYRFRLKAYNTAGDSLWSPEVGAITPN